MKTTTIAVVLGASLATSAAAADSPDIAEAKKRFAEGKALFTERKYDEARLKYVQACAVLRTDNCLRGLAIAELKADKPADAYKHFRELFDNPKAIANVDAAGLRDLQAMRDEAYAKSGHIAVDSPNGLPITLDGVEAGVTPIAGTLDVMPGPHQVAVRGDARRAVGVVATAGQVIRVKLAEDAGAPAAGGSPTPAAVPPPANNASAPAPGANPSAAPGAPGATSASAGFDSTAQRGDGGRMITILVLGGAAVVATAMGVYFLTQSGSAGDDVTRLKAANPNCAGSNSSGCAELASAADTRSTDKNLAVASFIGTGVFVGGAVAAYFLWPKPTNPQTSTGGFVVLPTMSAQGASLNITGRF